MTNNSNHLFVNNQYHTNKPKCSLANLSVISDDDLDSCCPKLRNNTNRTYRTTTYCDRHVRRQKDPIDIKSTFKNFRENQTKTNESVRSTPTSPSESEKIHIDLVDPILTPSTSIINNSIHFIDSNQHSHYLNQMNKVDL